jgi:beta-lactamase regulating signal transducer with metallopeptidase domain
MTAILEQINSTGRIFVEFAPPMLVQSSVLILILLLTDFALRKKVRAVFRYGIWLLVLIKLVLPTSLSAPLSLGYFFGDQLAYVDRTETTTEPAQTAPAIVSPMINPPRAEAGSDTSAIAPTTPTIEPAVAGPLSPPIVPVASLSWQGAVFLIWLS